MSYYIYNLCFLVKEFICFHFNIRIGGKAYFSCYLSTMHIKCLNDFKWKPFFLLNILFVLLLLLLLLKRGANSDLQVIFVYFVFAMHFLLYFISGR